MTRSRHGVLIRSVASMLALLFAGQETLLAAPEASTLVRNLTHPLVSFDLPASVGTVEDSYRGEAAAPKIILIQDAHTNASGQKNLAKAIERILEKEPVTHVFAEGESGDLSIAFLCDSQSQSALVGAAEEFLNKGLVKGSELANLKSDRTFTLWGVEDKPLYDKALGAYRKAAASREKALALLDRIDRSTAAMKDVFYSDALKKLDRAKTRYEAQEVPLTQYFELLDAMAREAGIDLSLFPELKALKDLQSKESAINLAAASLEEEAAINALPEADRQELASLKKPLQKLNRASGEDTRTFFLYLEEKLAGSGAAGRYPELFKYIAYIKASHSLKAGQALEEIAGLETLLYKTLASTSDQTALVLLSRGIALEKKLLSLQIGPDEYAQIQAHPELVDIRIQTGFINKKILDLKKHYDNALRNEPFLTQAVQDARAFYESSFERDQSFVKNLASKIAEQKMRSAILVTGGFHAKHLKELFKSRGLSYVSIIPNVYHETDFARYERLLLNGPAALYPALAAKALAPAGNLGDEYFVKTTPGMTQALQAAARLAEYPASVSGIWGPSGLLKPAVDEALAAKLQSIKIPDETLSRELTSLVQKYRDSGNKEKLRQEILDLSGRVERAVSASGSGELQSAAFALKNAIPAAARLATGMEDLRAAVLTNLHASYGHYLKAAELLEGYTIDLRESEFADPKKMQADGRIRKLADELGDIINLTQNTSKVASPKAFKNVRRKLRSLIEETRLVNGFFFHLGNASNVGSHQPAMKELAFAVNATEAASGQITDFLTPDGARLAQQTLLVPLSPANLAIKERQGMALQAIVTDLKGGNREVYMAVGVPRQARAGGSELGVYGRRGLHRTIGSEDDLRANLNRMEKGLNRYLRSEKNSDRVMGWIWDGDQKRLERYEQIQMLIARTNEWFSRSKEGGPERFVAMWRRYSYGGIHNESLIARIQEIEENDFIGDAVLHGNLSIYINPTDVESPRQLLETVDRQVSPYSWAHDMGSKTTDSSGHFAQQNWTSVMRNALALTLNEQIEAAADRIPSIGELMEEKSGPVPHTENLKIGHLIQAASYYDSRVWDVKKDSSGLRSFNIMYANGRSMAVDFFKPASQQPVFGQEIKYLTSSGRKGTIWVDRADTAAVNLMHLLEFMVDQLEAQYASNQKKWETAPAPAAPNVSGSGVEDPEIIREITGNFPSDANSGARLAVADYPVEAAQYGFDSLVIRVESSWSALDPGRTRHTVKLLTKRSGDALEYYVTSLFSPKEKDLAVYPDMMKGFLEYLLQNQPDGDKKYYSGKDTPALLADFSKILNDQHQIMSRDYESDTAGLLAPANNTAVKPGLTPAGTQQPWGDPSGARLAGLEPGDLVRISMNGNSYLAVLHTTPKKIFNSGSVTFEGTFGYWVIPNNFKSKKETPRNSGLTVIDALSFMLEIEDPVIGKLAHVKRGGETVIGVRLNNLHVAIPQDGDWRRGIRIVQSKKRVFRSFRFGARLAQIKRVEVTIAELKDAAAKTKRQIIERSSGSKSAKPLADGIAVRLMEFLEAYAQERGTIQLSDDLFKLRAFELTHKNEVYTDKDENVEAAGQLAWNLFISNLDLKPSGARLADFEKAVEVLDTAAVALNREYELALADGVDPAKEEDFGKKITSLLGKIERARKYAVGLNRRTFLYPESIDPYIDMLRGTLEEAKALPLPDQNAGKAASAQSALIRILEDSIATALAFRQEVADSYGVAPSEVRLNSATYDPITANLKITAGSFIVKDLNWGPVWYVAAAYSDGSLEIADYDLEGGLSTQTHYVGMPELVKENLWVHLNQRNIPRGQKELLDQLNGLGIRRIYNLPGRTGAPEFHTLKALSALAAHRMPYGYHGSDRESNLIQDFIRDAREAWGYFDAIYIDPEVAGVTLGDGYRLFTKSGIEERLKQHFAGTLRADIYTSDKGRTLQIRPGHRVAQQKESSLSSSTPTAARLASFIELLGRQNFLSADVVQAIQRTIKKIEDLKVSDAAELDRLLESAHKIFVKKLDEYIDKDMSAETVRSLMAASTVKAGETDADNEEISRRIQAILEAREIASGIRKQYAVLYRSVSEAFSFDPEKFDSELSDKELLESRRQLNEAIIQKIEDSYWIARNLENSSKNLKPRAIVQAAISLPERMTLDKDVPQSRNQRNYEFDFVEKPDSKNYLSMVTEDAPHRRVYVSPALSPMALRLIHDGLIHNIQSVSKRRALGARLAQLSVAEAFESIRAGVEASGVAAALEENKHRKLIRFIDGDGAIEWVKAKKRIQFSWVRHWDSEAHRVVLVIDANGAFVFDQNKSTGKDKAFRFKGTNPILSTAVDDSGKFILTVYQTFFNVMQTTRSGSSDLDRVLSAIPVEFVPSVPLLNGQKLSQGIPYPQKIAFGVLYPKGARSFPELERRIVEQLSGKKITKLAFPLHADDLDPRTLQWIEAASAGDDAAAAARNIIQYLKGRGERAEGTEWILGIMTLEKQLGDLLLVIPKEDAQGDSNIGGDGYKPDTDPGSGVLRPGPTEPFGGLKASAVPPPSSEGARLAEADLAGFSEKAPREGEYFFAEFVNQGLAGWLFVILDAFRVPAERPARRSAANGVEAGAVVARPWSAAEAKQALVPIVAQLRKSAPDQPVIFEVDGILLKGLDEQGMERIAEAVRLLAKNLNIHIVFKGRYGDLSAPVSTQLAEHAVRVNLASKASAGQLPEGQTGAVAEQKDGGYLPFTLIVIVLSALARNGVSENGISSSGVMYWRELLGTSQVFGEVPPTDAARAMALVDQDVIELLLKHPALARLTRSELMELFMITEAAVSTSA